jgi:hypothetical protein
MKRIGRIVGVAAAGLMLAAVSGSPVRAQGPEIVAPIVVSTAAPIIINATKPKAPAGVAKFEGFVMHANIAQITVRAKGDDMSIQTFSLSREASDKMQQIVDKGGYQWGDKVTVMYDPNTMKAVRVKGKPSRPI